MEGEERGIEPLDARCQPVASDHLAPPSLFAIYLLLVALSAFTSS